MARQTSIETYRKIEANGLLSKRRWQIYSALYGFGPCTANELHAKIKLIHSDQGNANVVTRLGELREMGVAMEVGERTCTITGMNVIVWDVTDKLPRKLEKKRRCEIWVPEATIRDEQFCNLIPILTSKPTSEGWVKFREQA